MHYLLNIRDADRQIISLRQNQFHSFAVFVLRLLTAGNLIFTIQA